MTQHRSRVVVFVTSIVLVAAGVAACSTDWPSFRQNDLRTGGQLNNGPLADPVKAQTLKVKWNFPASAGGVPNPLGGFNAGPIVYNGVVYIGNSNGYFYAINASDGKLKWQYPAAGSPPLTSTFLSNPSSYGIASSATIATTNQGDAVVFGAPDQSIGAGLGSGRLFALDPQTGSVIWKSPEIAVLLNDGVTHQQIGYSSPLAYDNDVYVGIADHGDDPIQQGKVVAVHASDGSIDPAFSFSTTGPPRGGGIWGSVAAWIGGLYVTTGNSNVGGPEPVPDNALSMLRLDPNTGSIVWSWKPVPYNMDDDPDWTSTPSVMLASCGVLSVSTEKDGWTWALNTGDGTPGPASVQWAFPPGPWSTSGFNMGDGTTHGDTRYLRPGAAWDDVYIVQTGGLNVTPNVDEGFKHLYALNACTSDANRVRWIADPAPALLPLPDDSGLWYSLGPPSVTLGMVYVGTTFGHLVVIGDPTIVPPDGVRCVDPDIPTSICMINGFSLVPQPHVVNDIDLGSGAITTEPALANNQVYVSTQGGNVIMLAPGP
jgi:outer membrane protein assembly factor BamB